MLFVNRVRGVFLRAGLARPEHAYGGRNREMEKSSKTHFLGVFRVSSRCCAKILDAFGWRLQKDGSLISSGVQFGAWATFVSLRGTYISPWSMPSILRSIAACCVKASTDALQASEPLSYPLRVKRRHANHVAAACRVGQSERRGSSSVPVKTGPREPVCQKESRRNGRIQEDRTLA